MVSAKLYDGRLAVDIAGLKMQTPVTTASGTFGFGLEFTEALNLPIFWIWKKLGQYV